MVLLCLRLPHLRDGVADKVHRPRELQQQRVDGHHVAQRELAAAEALRCEQQRAKQPRGEDQRLEDGRWWMGGWMEVEEVDGSFNGKR